MAGMNLTRAALAASVTTTVLWTAKAIVIAVAGGVGRSPLEGPLFLLGLLACVVAGVLVGAAFFVRRSPAWRTLGALLSFVVLTVVGGVVQALATSGAAHPPWWRGEVNLWAVMLTVLAGAVLARRREAAGTPAAAVEGSLVGG